MSSLVTIPMHACKEFCTVIQCNNRWSNDWEKLVGSRLAPERALRVLIVEDEGFIAMDLADQVRELGHKVVCSESTLEQGCFAAEHELVDFALLDKNLGGKKSFPVAHALRRRSIPFVFVTGYDVREMEAELSEIVTLMKPTTGTMLAEVLSSHAPDAR